VATWRSPLVAKQKSSLLARRVEQEREPLDGGVAVSSPGADCCRLDTAAAGGESGAALRLLKRRWPSPTGHLRVDVAGVEL